MKRTWSMILKMIIAVAGAIAGVIGVQAATM
ncbi:smalltalk protein [Bacteroides congonensis]